MEKIKTTFIGAGYRGMQLLKLLRHIPFFEIVAVADPEISDVGIPDIVCYNNGNDDYLNMLDVHKPDLVFVTSPWQYHVKHAMQSVDRGCHVALEIKGGLYLNEYQPLIDLAEQRGCRIYPLENTLFLREVIGLAGGRGFHVRGLLLAFLLSHEGTEFQLSVFAVLAVV